jgi:DNA-binding winged helix-turn-helix (wHTH) protein
MKSEEDIARIHTLFEDGLSKRQIASTLGISRNTVYRYLHSQSHPQSNSPTRAAPHKSSLPHTPANSNWRIGPYHLNGSGDLRLGDAPIDLAGAQAKILLILVKKANQLVSRDEIAKQLWPGQELSANQHRNVSLCMHRLRQVFSIGPLGDTVIRSVYGKGYILTAPVETCPPRSPQKTRHVHRISEGLIDNPFYWEVHDYWANRDPYKLARQEWLLQKSVQHNPTFEQGYLELCYFQLLQCFWGMRASKDVLPSLQQLLQTVDTFTPQPSGWLGIKAEVQSLLLWQPLTSQRLYGTWLADTLPRGMPMMAWARHLIFTGKPQTAIKLLKTRVSEELCQGWLLLAMAYCASGNLHAAEEAIQRQLSLDSTMVGTRLLWALLLEGQGHTAQATRLVLDTGILDRPFQGIQALAAYTLAQGSHHNRAQHLLDEAMTRIHDHPSQTGALGYWGLAALALEREVEAIHCLKLSVRDRCYSAPVLFATPFLKPYAKSQAYRLFAEKMGRAFPILTSTKP